jgi:hypothetical protein
MSKEEKENKINNEIIESNVIRKLNSEKTGNEKDISDKLYGHNNLPINLNKTEECLSDNEINDSINFYKKNNSENIEQNDIINIKKSKKVKFLEPEFVKVIFVESYKKFNEENTSKDPFDDSNLENINKGKEDKEKVLCSCLVV